MVVVASADEAIVGHENEKPLHLYAHKKRSIPTVQLALLETCAVGGSLIAPPPPLAVPAVDESVANKIPV
jgi:hypothetical protein